MACWFTLRRFVWTSKTNPFGVPEVVDITPVLDGDRRVELDVSDLILTNALATPVRRRFLYDATRHELRLLGSYLRQTNGQSLCLQAAPFHASALHIRRFVSESMGLGMLTATVQAVAEVNARGHMNNFDVLPAVLAGSYANRGTRPDLLFKLPEFRLAGEARGRSQRPPSAILKGQRDRLNQLLPWSEYHGNHPLVMTWAYITKEGTTVDLFVPEAGIPGFNYEVGEEAPQTPSWATAPAEYREGLLEKRKDRLSYARGSAGQRRFREARAQQDTAEGFDPTPPNEIADLVQRRARHIQEQLFATAPEAQVRVAGQVVRGDWTPLDLVGPSVGSLLFALLPEPLQPSDSWGMTEQLRARLLNRLGQMIEGQHRNTTPKAPSVTVRGRLLVAVLGEDITQPWDLLAD